MKESCPWVRRMVLSDGHHRQRGEKLLPEVKKKYGKHFDVIMKDLHQSNDLRVLDRVFWSFTLSKLGQPIYHEP